MADFGMRAAVKFWTYFSRQKVQNVCFFDSTSHTRTRRFNHSFRKIRNNKSMVHYLHIYHFNLSLRSFEPNARDFRVILTMYVDEEFLTKLPSLKSKNSCNSPIERHTKTCQWEKIENNYRIRKNFDESFQLFLASRTAEEKNSEVRKGGN